MQSSPGTIDPFTTNGPALATLITDMEKALLSNHSGTTRPTYAVAGTIWLNTTANPWLLKMFDGTHDVQLGTINPTTGVFNATVDLSAYATSASVTSALAAYVLTSAIGSAAAKTAGTGAGNVLLLTNANELPALDAHNLTHVFGFRAPDMWVRDEKTSGTAGGATVAATYTTRALTVVKRNIISGASLASNQITLPAGKYHVKFSAPANGAVGLNRCAIFDVTSGAYQGYGSNNQTPAATTTLSIGDCYIDSPSAALLLELRHRAVTAVATSGLGIAMSFGDIEVYGDVQIWKVD